MERWAAWGPQWQWECMGWTSAGYSQELTVSYTGCASFSLRHHSSRHILGVIWGEYARLGTGREGVRAHRPSALHSSAGA